MEDIQDGLHKTKQYLVEISLNRFNSTVDRLSAFM